MSFFNGKVIVITGASMGLGRALAVYFAQFSCKIAGLARNTEALQTLKTEVEAAGSEFLALTCDVSVQNDCEKSMTKVLEQWGQIDVLINNAGFTNISLFQPQTHVDIIRKVMETNFFGSVYCTAAALDSLVKQQGSIVNISSVAGFSPLIGRTAYSSSKHAMHGFFNTLGAELKEKKVHVMMVCPTFIQTSIRKNDMQKVETEALKAEYVSGVIARGIVEKRKNLIIGKTAIFAWWMNRFFPALYERIMIENQIKKVKSL